MRSTTDFEKLSDFENLVTGSRTESAILELGHFREFPETPQFTKEISMDNGRETVMKNSNVAAFRKQPSYPLPFGRKLV